MVRSHAIRAHLKKGAYVYAVAPHHDSRVCVYAPDTASSDGYSFVFTISRRELAACLRAYRRAGCPVERIRS